MKITSKMVKDLRDKTQAGMMDCKKALEKTEGDMEVGCSLLTILFLVVAFASKIAIEVNSLEL